MVTTVKLLLFLGFAASCLAAPLANNHGQCKPIGVPTKLLSYNSEDHRLLYFQPSDKGHNPKLLALNQSTEKFQFYECPPPSKDYDKSHKNYTFGLLHSVTHPGKCLTSGNTLVQTGDSGGEPDYKGVPNDDGTIRMYDCETTDSDIMRRQWMGLDYTFASDSPGECHLPFFFQEGRKEDSSQFSLGGDDKASSFGTPWKYALSIAYLHDKRPKACKGW